MTTLTELFTMSYMGKLKYERLYKTVNKLLHRNPNAWKYNTRELNEEISCDEKSCNEILDQISTYIHTNKSTK